MTDRKRPGMSDEDRALARLRTGNTPVAGVPIHAPAEEDFTPVASVIDRIAETFVPNDRERMVLHLMWQHTANMELRSRARRDTDGTTALVARIDAVETAVVDIRGEHGNNGKLGGIKERVDKAEARRWQVIVFLLGLLATVITTAVVLGRWAGRIETEVEVLKQRAYRARGSATPDYPAPKEGNTP